MDVLTILDKTAIIFEQWGYLIIFFGSLIEITPLGWAVPGGAILVIGGYLSNGNPNLPLVPMIIWGTLGAWIAFILAYLLGSRTGMWLVNKLNQQKNARFAKTLLQKNGGVILTTSMLANLTRFWISYVAGVDKYSFLKFNFYAFISSLSWVSLMTLLGFFAGYEKENFRKVTNNIGILAWVLLIIAIFVIVKSIRKEYKHFQEDELHLTKI